MDKNHQEKKEQPMIRIYANLFLILAGIAAVPAVLAVPYDPPIVHEKVHRYIDIDERGRYSEIVERVTRIVSEYGVDFLGNHVFETKSTQESFKILSASIYRIIMTRTNMTQHQMHVRRITIRTVLSNFT